MNDHLLIEAQHVYKSYSSVKAVVDLSFAVEKFSCFGFLGPNGAGKTTMMKILYGGLKYDNHPETKINVLGFDPCREELPIKYFSGVVPQDNNLDKELNVSQNLYIYSKFYGIPKRKAMQRIDELLELMELKEKKKAKIKELSGGMQRRLIIARALLNRPKLLILDEPTTGLDPQVRHLIWDKLRGLKRDGVTILITTHYMEEAFQICDKIIIMHNGAKEMEGNPKKLLEAGIEKHVLEIVKNGSLSNKLSFAKDSVIRKEEAHERVLFYSNELTALKKITECLSTRDYHLREANLEDLFLKTTGRGLNE
ncbi:ABC transporter ATP-binding protein [Candidatus Auribacterota bacterium]